MSAALLTQVVELKLGGKDIPVTTANRIAYIHLVADYRLNKQIRPHCLAFRQGLANVVNLEWLRMFDQQELQVRHTAHATPGCHIYTTNTQRHTSLPPTGADIWSPCANLSGWPQKVHKLLWYEQMTHEEYSNLHKVARCTVGDIWKKLSNTTNLQKVSANFSMLWPAGGYTATHPVIQTFWEVVEGFSEEEKRKLLKFVTSCSRPPLLGFKVRRNWSSRHW